MQCTFSLSLEDRGNDFFASFSGDFFLVPDTPDALFVQGEGLVPFKTFLLKCSCSGLIGGECVTVETGDMLVFIVCFDIFDLFEGKFLGDIFCCTSGECLLGEADVRCTNDDFVYFFPGDTERLLLLGEVDFFCDVILLLSCAGILAGDLLDSCFSLNEPDLPGEMQFLDLGDNDCFLEELE